ncbi:ABC transporter permease [Klebsiella pneumoniae]|nr:ABC transporter permease [Klebsiella pneumoniae]
MSETGISGAAGAEDGEEKAVCIGPPHKVHTVPVVSVRPRVALYFVNIFPEGNKSFCGVSPHNRLIFNQKKVLAYIGHY